MIQWGMIGAGSVTEQKSGPAFNKVPNSKLFGVMRRDAQKLKDYALRQQVPFYTTDVDALIAHPEINAIYIATPPDVHEQYAIKALAAGKDVYVEKPMALTVAACERMQAFAQKANKKLVIAHYRRALPLFLKVKELIVNNEIGVVQSVNIRMHKYAMPKESYDNNWRVQPAIAGGGFFYDLAPHQLDLVFYFFGKAISYDGFASNTAGLYEAEDTVHGKIEMESGIICNGDWCFVVDKGDEKDEFEIVGTQGKISFPVFGNSLTIQTNNQEQTMEFDSPLHNQQNLIEKIVSYFLDNGENPCSAADALQSMRVMEAFVYGKKLK